MIKKTVLIIFLTASLFAKNSEVTLLLTWKHQFQFAGYYMAKERGFYRDEGLHVNFMESNSSIDISKNVASGKYEFGVMHSPLILDMLNNYPNLKIMATINQSSPLVLISKSIKSLEDLSGKVVSISKNDLNNASINAMLHLNGLKKYNFVFNSSEHSLKNFSHSHVDLQSAYSSNEPYTLEKSNTPFRLFDPKDYGYNFYSDMLFTSQKLISSKPEVVKSFYDASLKGWDYAYKNIDETINVILKSYNTQHKTKDALLFEASVLKKLAYVKDTPFGHIDSVKLQEIATVYNLLGLVKNKKQKKVDCDTFIYSYAQNRELSTKDIIINFYKELKEYITASAIMLFVILVGVIYFRYKLKYALAIKTKELKKSYTIFDEYTIASKVDKKGRITFVTQAFCDSCGYSEEELMGQNHNMLQDRGALDKRYYKDMWMSITSGHTWSGEFHNIKKDGQKYSTQSVITPLFDSHNSIIGYEGVRHDTTAKRVLEDFNKKLELEVKDKTEAIERYSDYLNTLFDINPNIIYILDKGEVERVNRAFLEFTEVEDMEEFLDKHHCICDLFDRYKHDPIAQEQKNHCTVDKEVSITKGSTQHIFRLTNKKFQHEEDEKYLVTLEDITLIQTLATTDKLTGLFNRVKIDDEIARNYSYFLGFQDIFSVIIVDIDFFKNVNDNYGHLIGDKVLEELAEVLKNSTRKSDIIGRWGGEEFLVICPNTDKSGAVELAESIRSSVKLYEFSRNLKITVSLGVCDISQCHDTNDLIKNADTSLYKAKTNGRNRVECHEC